jgi:dCMP deaminase
MTNKWDERFCGLAAQVAVWSKDPERKVGAVIVNPDRRVVGVGYNGFPRDVSDTAERLNNVEERRLMSVHAETNAVLNAWSMRGSTLYSTSFPCAGCAGIIIQAGISRVVAPLPEKDSSWATSWDMALAMFKEAEVNTYLYRIR